MTDLACATPPNALDAKGVPFTPDRRHLAEMGRIADAIRTSDRAA